MYFRHLLLAIVVLVSATACQPVNPNWETEAANPQYLHRGLKQLTDVIVHDIFSPPVASRIYAYANIAAYETLAAGNLGLRPLAGQLNGLSPAPAPEPGQTYCWALAAVQAQLKVGQALIFSEEDMARFTDSLLLEFRQLQLPSDVYARSVAYGQSVADHILAWSKTDGYAQTRTAAKFTVEPENTGRWQPTPPAYMDGIEPHWRDIRPFTLDSAQQFKPAPPTPFSIEPGSPFYTEAMEVYRVGEPGPEQDERLAIASFWDCNPYVSHQYGHVMYATKKITPGGHWMGIAGLVAQQSQADLAKTAEIYALTAVALADGFISCWDEKYRSNLIRPETYLNRYVDPEWRPLLQTPPFPEHTSGHSVISRAAAVTLTHLLGPDVAFEDTVEVEYGLPVRRFSSFMQASEEAAISRLYGGIHYRPAIEEGVKQGEQVGKWVVAKVITRG